MSRDKKMDSTIDNDDKLHAFQPNPLCLSCRRQKYQPLTYIQLKILISINSSIG